ncbi:MAG: T9SS type A sorting domain-containing protein [Paludibacter sp.]
MKNNQILLFLLFIFVTPTFAQKVRFSLLFPPMKVGDPYWNDVNTYVLPSPLITDVTVAMKWSDIETSQGIYDFSTFDAQLIHFYTAGKKVNIVTQPISPSGKNSFTPAYIFTPEWASSLGVAQLDVITCSSFAGDGSANSGLPVPYEVPFKQGLKNFFTQVINHYKNNANIAYIRLGLAIGGDFYPRCSSVMPGFSTKVWTDYAAEMNSFEASLNPTMQLMQSVCQISSANDGNADIEAENAVKNGISIGVQGWEISDNTAKTCTSDWCALFEKYSGKISPLELQTLAASDPTGISQTGSLVDLIPFALAHKAQMLELYTIDWLLALDPNYSTLYGSSAAFVPYASAYLKTISDASVASGVESVNADLQGNYIYPNPSRTNLNIYSPFVGLKNVQIYNSIGQLILDRKFPENKISIDTAHFTSGLYVLNIKDNNSIKNCSMKYIQR